MSTIALELDQLMSRLDPRAAETLESRVRDAMAHVAEREGDTPTPGEMKRRRPELADLIGCLAGVEFELSSELPMPPAKTW